MNSNEEEKTEDGDIVGVDDFISYSPVLGCMVVPACGIALLLSWLINQFGAPAWTTYTVGLVYVTLPFAAFTWWSWNRKAIRLRDGRVLQGRAARRFALTLWLIATVVILYRFMTW
ncbi:hypothetical protein [Sphingomonas sp. PB4P5]|uniref:hypothetical protein n=1 Tax=Parasphingomonas puruogangriensis TaxID=3096155 RepID=UPI002FC929CE